MKNIILTRIGKQKQSWDHHKPSEISHADVLNAHINPNYWQSSDLIHYLILPFFNCSVFAVSTYISHNMLRLANTLPEKTMVLCYNGLIERWFTIWTNEHATYTCVLVRSVLRNVTCYLLLVSWNENQWEKQDCTSEQTNNETFK